MIFIIGLILGAVMVVFVLQNAVPISVVFLGWQFDGSLALVLILAIIGGMVLSALLSLPELVRKEFKLSKLKRDNRNLSSELESHKQKLVETEIKLAESPKIIEKETIIVSNE
ncbi:MAG: hypothetical protein RL641_356 [Candidatus Parcubacteria bacterium]|jgi:uncharacterized integral membrane protein